MNSLAVALSKVNYLEEPGRYWMPIEWIDKHKNLKVIQFIEAMNCKWTPFGMRVMDKKSYLKDRLQDKILVTSSTINYNSYEYDI